MQGQFVFVVFFKPGEAGGNFWSPHKTKPKPKINKIGGVVWGVVL
jgi:hypothetical protein